MEMKNKIAVLLSGGIDSTTCLAIAVDKVGAENVVALSLFYGQKHAKELECAKRIAEYYGVKHYVKDLSTVMEFSNCPLLANSTEEIKHTTYADQLKELGGEGTVSTYIPFRNGFSFAFSNIRSIPVRMFRLNSSLTRLSVEFPSL
jgi:7-cyano-7-deazaguanine synthase